MGKETKENARVIIEVTNGNCYKVEKVCVLKTAI